MSELKKCPFCGGEAVVVGDKYHWVVCRGCKGSSYDFKTVEEAITAWNTRKPVERIVEALEERLEGQHKLYAIAFDPEYCGGYDAYSDAIRIVKEIMND